MDSSTEYLVRILNKSSEEQDGVPIQVLKLDDLSKTFKPLSAFNLKGSYYFANDLFLTEDGRYLIAYNRIITTSSFSVVKRDIDPEECFISIYDTTKKKVIKQFSISELIKPEDLNSIRDGSSVEHFWNWNEGNPVLNIVFGSVKNQTCLGFEINLTDLSVSKSDILPWLKPKKCTWEFFYGFFSGAVLCLLSVLALKHKFSKSGKE